MAVHELSRADARRIAVRAQLLDSERPDGLLDLLAMIRPSEDMALALDLVPR